MGPCAGLTGRDTLDTTSAGETSDSGLGDTLDVVAKNLAVTLGTSLAEALAALATCLRAWSAATRSEKGVERTETTRRNDATSSIVFTGHVLTSSHVDWLGRRVWMIED